MNEPDYINNRYQQSEAMYNAEKVFEEFAEEYAELTGREYPILDLISDGRCGSCCIYDEFSFRNY